MHELHVAIAILSFCPHLVTYLDAGAADAIPAAPAGAYWPQYAIGLVRHADFAVR